MTLPMITKTLKLTPDDYDRVTEAMKRTGVLNFTEFVRRALDTEIRMSQLREKHIYDLMEQEQVAEEQAPYKKANGKKAAEA